MKEESLIWRLVFEKVATLQEIETSWSLDDSLRAIAILEYKNAVSEEQRKKLNDSRQRASNKA